MPQTKRVAAPSAQTFLQPSAPIKSVRHPAIATRHAPADPDTTHLLAPNSGPTQADDTRHRQTTLDPGKLYTSSVPKPPGSRSPGTYRFRAPAPSPGKEGHNRAADPLCVPQRTSAQETRRPLRCHPETSSLSCCPGTPHTGPAKEQPRRLFRLFRRTDRTDRSCRPLPAFFPQATPTAQSRRPAVRKHSRTATACPPLETAPHHGTPAIGDRPPPLRCPRGNPAQVPTAARNTARSTAPPLHRPPGPRKRSTHP